MALLAFELPFFTSANNDTLIICATIVVIAVTIVVTRFLYRSKKTEAETELKRDMVARGMSADEIERVMRAAATKETQPYIKS